MSRAGIEESTARDAPWERWGWLMFGIWLIFLSFPLISALDGSLENWQYVVGIGSILAFGGVYLGAFFWVGGDPEADREPWGYLAVMVALISVASTAIGVSALGMTPFLV